MPTEHEHVLVCSRLEGYRWRKVGAIISRCCSKCGERVIIARPGQLVLGERPDAKIVCWVCIQPTLELPTTIVTVAPGAIEEYIGDLKEWAKRN